MVSNGAILTNGMSLLRTAGSNLMVCVERTWPWLWAAQTFPVHGLSLTDFTEWSTEVQKKRQGVQTLAGFCFGLHETIPLFQTFHKTRHTNARELTRSEESKKSNPPCSRRSFRFRSSAVLAPSIMCFVALTAWDKSRTWTMNGNRVSRARLGDFKSAGSPSANGLFQRNKALLCDNANEKKSFIQRVGHTIVSLVGICWHYAVFWKSHSIKRACFFYKNTCLTSNVFIRVFTDIVSAQRECDTHDLLLAEEDGLIFVQNTTDLLALVSFKFLEGLRPRWWSAGRNLARIDWTFANNFYKCHEFNFSRAFCCDRVSVTPQLTSASRWF